MNEQLVNAVAYALREQFANTDQQILRNRAAQLLSHPDVAMAISDMRSDSYYEGYYDGENQALMGNISDDY